MRKRIEASCVIKKKGRQTAYAGRPALLDLKPEIRLVPAHGLPYNCSGLNGR